MEYDSERAMYEAYSRNKYASTGVIQWMLNNAWPSMIWHLYDYYLDAGAGYFGTKKACEPVHIQYSYDDRSIVVVNSTYQRVAGLHASVDVRNVAWKQLYKQEAPVDAGADSSQVVVTIPESLYTDAERTFFIDLSLKDAAGKVVSRNFYWVPGTLTTFDWSRTDYTHTPAARHEDLSALSSLPAAKLVAHAEVEKTARGREVRVELENPSAALAFQVSAAVRTQSGGLIAPVLWSDNWIELAPGEKRVLTALLPEGGSDVPKVEIASWNAGALDVTPTIVSASAGR
jgi:exo-1,4-beta-D-glucosaminidase